MWKKFDESLGVTSNLQLELCRNGGGSGWTRGMVNSFLMRNGSVSYTHLTFGGNLMERKSTGVSNSVSALTAVSYTHLAGTLGKR